MNLDSFFKGISYLFGFNRPRVFSPNDDGENLKSDCDKIGDDLKFKREHPKIQDLTAQDES